VGALLALPADLLKANTMTQRTHTHRRAGSGTLIVRASTLAVGLAASVGLQLSAPEQQATAAGMADNPSILCALDANGSFAFQ
jgi:hypothetical protein